MAKYYQHLNSNDDNFQSVTELEIIDNSDPSFVLYYFKDGTKCAKDFIGVLNSKDVYGRYEMVEVSSPSNSWKFEKINLQSEKKFAVNAQGEQVMIDDPYMNDQSNKPKTKIEAVYEPALAQIQELDSDYYMVGSTKQANAANNVQPQMQQLDVIEPQLFEANFDDSYKNSNIETTNNTNNSESYIDAEYMLNTNKNVVFKYNGKTYNMPAKEFFANAIKYPEEKIVEKIVEIEKPVEQKNIEEHLIIDLSDSQKVLIDNMIDMSNKNACDLDMELTLKLPPIQVYKLIKTSYPDGMAKAFVYTIADRMKVIELKNAVAAGLMAYYDEDEQVEINVSCETNKQAETIEKDNKLNSEEKVDNIKLDKEVKAKSDKETKVKVDKEKENEKIKKSRKA